MKKFFGLLGVFVLFLVVVIAGLAMFPPVDLAKRLMVAGTRSKTGLELRINGPMTLSLVPRVALHMENVVLVDPAAAASAPIVTARAIDLDAGWAATLGAARTLESVTISDPVIVVEADKDGRLAWQPASAATRDPSAHAARAFSFNRVEVKGGTFSYRDQRSGLTARLERSDVTLRGVSQDGIGEADVKAASAVLIEPGSGTSVEAGNVETKAKELTLSRIASLSASGATLRWRDRSQPTGIEATKFSVGADGLGLDGSGRIAFNGGTVKWQDPASKATLDAEAVETSAATLRAARLGDVKFKSGRLAFAHPANGSFSITNLDGTAKSARVEGLEGISLKSTAATYVAASGATVRAGMVTAAAQNATLADVRGLAVSSGTLSVGEATRAGGSASAVELRDVSIAAPVIAAATPVEASVAFVHKAERVDGTVKLPAADAIVAGGSVPAAISLKAARGTIDFDGQIETAGAAAAKGRVHATSNAVDGLATWLGMSLPATVKGSADLSGTVEATATRIALSDARLAHGGMVASGAIAVDVAGQRPKLSGRIAADKIDADAYLGLAPVAARPSAQPKPAGGKPQIVEPEVELGDVFKTYMRAMLDQPVKRGATLEIPAVPADQLIPAATRARPPSGFRWSDDKFDLSGLRAMDIDVDWTVKSLGVRGLTLSVPQLKTALDDGTLTLEGSDIGSNNGKLSGRARLDTRQPVPAVSATVKGQGLDVQALFEAAGVTPMLDGITTLDADVRSTGVSQRQIVEQLSGSVRTNMAEGHVLGYDLGNITFGTVIRWLTGNREYDPERRTPVTGLITDLAIEKGVVKDSRVTMGGPLLGVNAEGTIGLVEQRLDMSGRARIASFFSGLPFRVFGSWSRPTVQPDLNLASVFSRAGPGEPTLADIAAGAEIKPDPELALLIGRIFQKAGPDGLDAPTRALLESVQKRALGYR